MEFKICKKCGLKKDINEFYKRKSYKDNYDTICKSCKKEYYQKNKEKILDRIHKYYKENDEYIKKYQRQHKKENFNNIKTQRKKHYEENKDIILEKRKIYYLNNKDKIDSKKKIYRELNKDKIKEIRKKYSINNKEKINNYFRNKYKNDYIYKFVVNIRNRINGYMKRKGKTKNKHTEEIIGCNYNFLTSYLLETFKNNYGYEWDKKEKIHIDHIIPLSTAKTEEEVIKLNHYTNLQLLKEKDNLQKSNKLNWKL